LHETVLGSVITFGLLVILEGVMHVSV
jgi:hypothetical protein